MSSKKITDADKLEIADLYRQSGETTSSLASRYGVSNSTIARILKNSIPEAEYDSLVRGKRGSRGSAEDESDAELVDGSSVAQVEIRNPSEPIDSKQPAAAPISNDPIPSSHSEFEDSEETGNSNRRRVRRRAVVPNQSSNNVPTTSETSPATADTKSNIESSIVNSHTLQEILADSQDRYFAPPVADESDEDAEDVNALAAMFGEEIADSEDDEDFAEEEWEDDAATNTYNPVDRDRILTVDRLHVRVKPLSQATLPRTCYIVVDKFAELIVRPLKDFADLGQIPSEEILQRTLPVFDNHRVAKRFSNQRTQRVIKVPDSRVFYKTTSHLRSKGIACLLVDGNIYSLN